MLRRILVIAFLSLGILAIPSLCRAGVLDHACSCGDASSCAHEADCGSDPCSTAKSATSAVTPVQILASPALLVAFAAELHCQTLAPMESWAQSSELRPDVPACLRPGARPLLI
ncbi:MAG: hypothetical protein HOP12_01400 [Candidatus Eisenbacteria bacterium]|uniref:Uncharacterized protein n=1 Tax=Eiseniibacteriota bacterium TaxID=2212470 RepID=A0A849SGW8_UNCEI|nr:hypothetical protein [Candidatus Eisenbacteria bacterium]